MPPAGPGPREGDRLGKVYELLLCELTIYELLLYELNSSYHLDLLILHKSGHYSHKCQTNLMLFDSYKKTLNKIFLSEKNNPYYFSKSHRQLANEIGLLIEFDRKFGRLS